MNTQEVSDYRRDYKAFAILALIVIAAGILVLVIDGLTMGWGILLFPFLAGIMGVSHFIAGVKIGRYKPISYQGVYLLRSFGLVMIVAGVFTLVCNMVTQTLSVFIMGGCLISIGLALRRASQL